MESKYQLRFDAKLRLQAFCVIHNIPLMLLMVYPDLKIALNLVINKIYAAKAINEANLTHFASTKDILQKVLVETVFDYQRLARVYARFIHNDELFLSLNHEKNYMSDNNDELVGDRADEIIKIIKENIALLLNIENSNVVEMEAARDAYRAELLKPHSAISDRKAYGTDLIPILLKEADDITDDISDLVHSSLKEHATDWDARAKIGKWTGKRHTSLIIKYQYLSEKVPLKNITCTLERNTITHKKKSTKDGYVRFFDLPNGPWICTSESLDYETDLQPELITDTAKIIRLTLTLKKKNETFGSFKIAPVNKNTNQPFPELHLNIPILGRTFDAGEDTFFIGSDIPVNNYEGIISGTHIQDQAISITITPNNQTTLTFPVDPTPPKAEEPIS